MNPPSIKMHILPHRIRKEKSSGRKEQIQMWTIISSGGWPRRGLKQIHTCASLWRSLNIGLLASLSFKYLTDVALLLLFSLLWCSWPLGLAPCFLPSSELIYGCSTTSSLRLSAFQSWVSLSLYMSWLHFFRMQSTWRGSCRHSPV